MKLRFIGFLFYAESCKFFGTNSYQKGEEKTRPFIFFFKLPSTLHGNVLFAVLVLFSPK